MERINTIIEEFTRQELKRLVGESEELIRNAVKKIFLTEIRSTVRESIMNILEELTKETYSGEKFPIFSDEDKRERSETKVDIKVDYEQEAEAPLGERATEATCGSYDLNDRHIYIYCVSETKEEVRLGKLGINAEEIFTITYDGLSVIGQSISGDLINLKDEEILKEWAVIHQGVIDVIWNKFKNVIPISFLTVIKGGEDLSPEDNVRKWMEENYEDLKKKMLKVKGKAEFGVQVFWEPQIIAQKLTEECSEIKELYDEISSKPEGVAYMYKQQLENVLKKEMVNQAERYFTEFHDRIKSHISDLIVEKTKKTDGEKQMIMNLSCLLPNDGANNLGRELEKIDEMEGFHVKYTGPWPPYSFVN